MGLVLLSPADVRVLVRFSVRRPAIGRFFRNVRTQLFALACNLGSFLGRLALPKSVREWSLRKLREKLIKIGAKVVRHSRYVVFQMAEVVVPRALFRQILERISRLRASPELLRTG